MSVVNVLIDPDGLPDLHAALQDTPALSGLIMMTENRRAFEDTISQNIVVVNGVYAAIAILITIGVAYNGARIQMSERARELASLRILGFSRAEVSSVLVGEMMLLAISRSAAGLGAGRVDRRCPVEQLFVRSLRDPAGAGGPRSSRAPALSCWPRASPRFCLVRRRIDRMDLVAVMKTRE